MWRDFLTNDDLLIHKWTHYFPIYERHLERFRNLDITLLEVGVSHGGSLGLWKRFLGPYAKIVGIDINDKCTAAATDQISVRIGSQNDTKFLNSVITEFGIPDIIIDDGSHQMHHINITFDFLYPKQPKNSIYIVEDLHTAYWKEYGGGLGNVNSFIERSKGFIDLLNADHAQGQIEPDNFTKTTSAIHFYDSVVVFEKQGLLKKHAPQYGKKLFE